MIWKKVLCAAVIAAALPLSAAAQQGVGEGYRESAKIDAGVGGEYRLTGNRINDARYTPGPRLSETLKLAERAEAAEVEYQVPARVPAPVEEVNKNIKKKKNLQ